jgi:glycerophosphoryl diester phosphodiesterase
MAADPLALPLRAAAGTLGAVLLAVATRAHGAVLVAIAALASVVSLTPARTATDASIDASIDASTGATEVIGHRGAPAELPENTLPSFAHALAAGADAIELDVQETKDHVVIVHHDATVNLTSCTQTRGAPIAPDTRLRDLTFAQTQQLDCGSRTDPHFPQQRPAPGATIPSLARVLALVAAAPNHPRIYLELKRAQPQDVPDPAAFARLVVATVTQAAMLDRVVLMSFDAELLAAAHAAAPRAALACLFANDAAGDLVDHALNSGARTLAPDARRADRALVARAHARGVRVVPWTVNDPSAWRELRARGVDGIITDDPRGLRDLRATGPHGATP